MSLWYLCADLTKNPKGSVLNGEWQVPVHFSVKVVKCKFKPPKNTGQRDNKFHLPLHLNCDNGCLLKHLEWHFNHRFGLYVGLEIKC